MRKLLPAICFVVIILVHSSAGYSQTTLEEYNYVTKGYKVQVESGLDMKKGYRFDDVHTIHIQYSDGVARETEFKALLREGQKMPAAILCIYSHSDKQDKDYLCIPQFNSSKEVWDSTYARLSAIQGDNIMPLMYGLAKLTSYYSMK